MWVKICANTNVEDALRAAELGADAVGFVFAPSVRQVTPAQVARITERLPERLERVGVFAASTAGEIAAAVSEAGLTTVQLHGGLDLDLVRALRGCVKARLQIIQALHWVVDDGDASHVEITEQLRQIAREGTIDRILIDSKIGTATGGTGVAFDWNAARRIFRTPEHQGIKLILAGGLRPENLDAAIRTLEPWGVDVASGVEASAGRKDLGKVARFMELARKAGAISVTPR